MAEAAGLVSAILAFLQVAYAVGTRTAEFARASGELPSDFRLTQELIDIIARSAERLRLRLPGAGYGAALGPQTEQETALIALFDRLTELSNKFLCVLQKLSTSNSLLKAIISVRKERTIEKIRNELDRCILSIRGLQHCPCVQKAAQPLHC